MNAVARDLRYALRLFAKKPGFVLVAVVTLALGIGLNSAVFSVVNGVLLRPLPVAAPEELLSVYSSVPNELMSHAPMATADFEDLRDGAESLAEVIAYTYTPLALERAGESRLVLGERVTSDYFAVLGVEPVLGRAFLAGDESSEAAPAVLSHTAWQRRYGADPEVVGTRLRVNGRPATVVGVAPEGFSNLTRGFSPELWLPLDLHRRPGTDRLADRQNRWLWVVGRRAPGTSTAAARAEVETLAARLRQEFPETHADRDFAVVPTRRVRILPGVDGTLFAASFVLMGGVALVLLIASANVAHMLLARAAGRRQEIATRLSLGAGPGAVVRQLLTESLLLALAGGAAGLVCALATNAALKAWRLPIPVDLAFGPALDVRVFLFTLAASTATALVFGLAPALAAGRTDLAVALREGAGAVLGGRRHRRGSSALVVAQVALSLLLLIGAGLALSSLRHAHRIDPGFDADGVVVASFAPRLQGYGEREAEELYRELTARVRALPGVESAGITSHLPLSVEITFESVAAAGEESLDDRPRVDAATAGPGYFETLRIPLLQGRTFDLRDTTETPPVAVVNETLARRFWPGETALGRQLSVAGMERGARVVGVVADGKYRTLGEPPRPFLYLAFAQRWRRSAHAGEITTGTETLVMRAGGDPRTTLAAVRRTARELDDKLAVSRLATLEEALAPALALPRAAAALLGAFGFLGLVLAATGIYGVMAYSVSQRTHEIGVRMALGARPGDVLRLVMRQGLVLTAAGVAAGLTGALASTRALAAFLYGVAATDAWTWAAVTLFLATVALAASYVPARRAAGVDPLAALRHE